MNIEEVYNTTSVHKIEMGASYGDAVKIFRDTQASDLMVVDAEDNFIGVLSEGDVIRKALPDFQELLSHGESLSSNLDIFIDKGKDMRNTKIDDIVIKAPITVTPSQPIIKAATIMTSKQIRRLPVIKDNKLVGVVSRSDICHGIIDAA